MHFSGLAAVSRYRTYQLRASSRMRAWYKRHDRHGRQRLMGGSVLRKRPGACPGLPLVVLHKSRVMHRPVHGASREAVIAPAFMPRKTGAHYGVFSPVHGAYYLLGLSHPGSPVNGAGRKSSGAVCEPGVNTGPNTAARKPRERGKPASGRYKSGQSKLSSSNRSLRISAMWSTPDSGMSTMSTHRARLYLCLLN